MLTPTTLSNAPKVPFNLDGRVMFSSVKVEMVHLTLNPGEEIPVHTNPFAVVFYLLQGELILRVDEEEVLLRPDMAISVEPNLSRGLYNASKMPSRVLVVKIF